MVVWDMYNLWILSSISLWGVKLMIFWRKHEEDPDSTSVGDRRIAITQAVAAAWSWLHQYKHDTIIKALSANRNLTMSNRQ